jgi:hypothetical protein
MPALRFSFWFALLLASFTAAAHDVPTDVRINAFVRPAGDRLELLVRVPLSAMQDIDYPLRGKGYLAVSRAGEALRDATKLWLIDNIDLYEDGKRLAGAEIGAARVSLPSDRSFASYEDARRRIEAPPLPDELDVYWNQQFLDVLIRYPIASAAGRFAIHPRVDRLGLNVTTVLRFGPPDAGERAFEFHGDPGLVELDPRWWQAARRFVVSGFEHILEGVDHLLFLFCLVVPFRRLVPLAVIVTSFTVAHSISLSVAALGFVPDALWFPPLVETLIAATILYTAIENIFGSDVPRRWIVAFAFGLVHGFGFSFALRESFQFAGDHLVLSLLAFNTGVELGQLAVLLLLVPLLELFLRRVPERLGIIVLSALAAHTAWHWMLERWEALKKFPFPALDAAFFAGLMRGTLAVLLLAALVYAANGFVKRWLLPERPPAGD